MWARRLIAGRPDVVGLPGSGRFLVRTSLAVRRAAHWQPTRFPPPPQQPPPQQWPPVNYQQPQYGGRPPSGGGPRYGRLALLISAIAAIAYLAGRSHDYLSVLRIFGEVDPDEARFWREGSESLQNLEEKADDPYRTLFQEARRAIDKKDWAAARHALAEAWKKTEGMEGCRLDAFNPVLIRLLLKLYRDADKNNGEPHDSSDMIRFAEEILPVMDEARTLPMTPDRLTGPWKWLKLNSLGIRCMLAGAILQEQRSKESLLDQDTLFPAGTAERIESILKPSMEEMTKTLEDIRIRSNFSYNEGDRATVERYCQLVAHLADHFDRDLESIRFFRYRAMIINPSPGDGLCDSLIKLAEAMFTHLMRTAQAKHEGEGSDSPFFKDRVRSEFKDSDRVLTMPLEHLAGGNAAEMLAATQEIANWGLAMLGRNEVEPGHARDFIEVQSFTLAAKMCHMKDDMTQSQEFLMLAEKSAKAHLRRPTGSDRLLRIVRGLKEALEQPENFESVSVSKGGN